jgi:GTP-binding protein Era
MGGDPVAGGHALSADAPQRRFGFVAIIGAPNAGKSTLVNMLVGAKVTIVSHKVQTTRIKVRGIYVEGDSQVALIDTPGIFAPKRRLDRAMVEAAWAGASEADAVALIVDATRGIDDKIQSIATKLKSSGGRKILILNKIDRLDSKDELLALAKRLSEETGTEEVFMLSALTGDGVDVLRRQLAGMMPVGPWHFPEDDITDLPLRMLASEITREKMLKRLHDELPYSATVETTSWKELKDGSVRIEQTLFVERDGQKKIVLGKGGATIKQISSEARTELKDILERNVHLFLFVKVRQNWGDDPERYREMGLQFPKD